MPAHIIIPNAPRMSGYPKQLHKMRDGNLNQLMQKLSGCWNFDEPGWAQGGAYDIIDKSYYNSHGIAYNGATTAYNGVAAFGRCGYFDGVNDEVNIPHNSELSIPTGTNYTASIWVYRQGVTKAVFNKSDGTITNYGLFIDATGKTWFYIDNHLGTRVSVYSNAAITASTWVHVVIMVDSGNMKTYINGVLQTDIKAVPTGTINNIAVIHVGISYAGTYAFVGGLNGLMIWKDRVLTQDEITWLYNVGAGNKFMQ